MLTVKILLESPFDSFNHEPEHFEPHNIFNKKTGKIVSTHETKGAAYQQLAYKHSYHPDMTVLHHASTQYGQKQHAQV